MRRLAADTLDPRPPNSAVSASGHPKNGAPSLVNRPRRDRPPQANGICPPRQSKTLVPQNTLRQPVPNGKASSVDNSSYPTPQPQSGLEETLERHHNGSQTRPSTKASRSRRLQQAETHPQPPHQIAYRSRQIRRPNQNHQIRTTRSQRITPQSRGIRLISETPRILPSPPLQQHSQRTDVCRLLGKQSQMVTQIWYPRWDSIQ